MTTSALPFYFVYMTLCDHYLLQSTKKRYSARLGVPSSPGFYTHHELYPNVLAHFIPY